MKLFVIPVFLLIVFLDANEAVYYRPVNAKDICTLPPVIGNCRAAMPRWAFNVKTGKCEKFTYGGCGGNANNFETEEDCLTRCVQRRRPRVYPIYYWQC